MNKNRILHLDDPMFSGSILLQHDLCVLSSLLKERLGEVFPNTQNPSFQIGLGLAVTRDGQKVPGT